MSPFRVDGSPTLLRPGEPSFLSSSVLVGVREDGVGGFLCCQSARRTQVIGVETTG